MIAALRHGNLLINMKTTISPNSHQPGSMNKQFNSLYIHIPFCRSKCDYCAFYSLPADINDNLFQRFIDRLQTEFSKSAPTCTSLRSIFIGGGTPSSLSTKQLIELMKLISRFFCFNKVEYTVECNPESFSREKATILAEYGVNRISLGIQSFNKTNLRALGRKGRPRHIKPAVDACLDNGITNINFDLIYGIPGQSASDWQRELEQAFSFPIKHLSAYSLTFEEGTNLSTRHNPIPDEQLTEMWHVSDAICLKNNTKRYEISNFSVPAFQCIHNSDIWHGGTYLGCGPAACTFDGENRFTNPHSLELWLNKTPPSIDKLPAKARAREIFAFGMRTIEGWNIPAFEDRFHQKLENLYSSEIQYLIEEDLLTISNNRITPTESGLLFSDTVLETLI